MPIKKVKKNGKKRKPKIKFEENISIINSDNKMIARLNAMRYVLSKMDYPGRKDLKPKKWTTESPVYNISVFNVQFNNLNLEQYELLNKIKGHE